MRLVFYIPLLFSLLSFRSFADAPAAEKLTILLEKWPGDLHPIRTVTLEGVFVANQVYDTLLRLGPGSQIIPNLVESWTYQAEAKRFDFQLKKGIQFSNGQPLTSAHIVQMFEGVLKANNLRNFDKIVGAKEFVSGKAKSISGIQVNGPHAFSVRLANAYTRFLEELADPYATVFLNDGKRRWVVGTGSFEIGEEKRNSLVRLVRNKNAAEIGASNGIQQVDLTLIPSPAVDIAFVEPPAEIRSAMKETSYFDTEVYLLGFNSAHPNLRDQQTRATLASYLTPHLVNSTLGPVDYPIGGLIPLGMLGHNPDLKTPEPKEKIKPKEPVEVWNYLPRLTPLADAYCNALKKDGIPCQVKAVSATELVAGAGNKKGAAQIFLMRQKSTNYSAEYLMSCVTSGNNSNVFTLGKRGDIVSDTIDGMLKKVQELPSGQSETVQSRLKEMDKAIVDFVLAKPFRYGANRVLWIKPDLQLPQMGPLGPFSLKLDAVKRKK